jgi:hypothetical protein
MEIGPVGQSGQRVMQRHMGNARLVAAPVTSSNVTTHRHQPGRLATDNTKSSAQSSRAGPPSVATIACIAQATAPAIPRWPNIAVTMSAMGMPGAT